MKYVWIIMLGIIWLFWTLRAMYELVHEIKNHGWDISRLFGYASAFSIWCWVHGIVLFSISLACYASDR